LIYVLELFITYPQHLALLCVVRIGIHEWYRRKFNIIVYCSARELRSIDKVYALFMGIEFRAY
jgi:hypothetical protein